MAEQKEDKTDAQYLKEIKERFEAAVQAVQGILWTNNAEGKMLGEQEGWSALTGQTYEEYQGYGWAVAVHPEDAESTINAWNEAVLQRKTFIFEHRVKVKDGSWRLFSVRAVPVFNDDGTIREWVGIHTDITTERKAREHLLESEERFRSLADQSPMIVYIVEPNEEATMSYFNKVWLDYTAQSFEQAIGGAWDGIVHPEDLQSILDIYVPAFQARISYTLPAVRLRRYDGEYRWHIFKGNPRYYATGEFIGFVGIGIDIHEQKLAENKVRESEQQWQLLANTVPSFVWTAAPDGLINYFNDHWYNYTGLTVDESLRTGWAQVLHPDDVENCLVVWNNALKKGIPYEVEVRYRGKNNQYRWVVARAVPVKSAEGNITGWYGTSTDIHDQKTIEEQLEALIRERTIELQRSNEDLQQFAHVASHDLKEPLRKIRTFGSRLSEEYGELLPDKGKNYLEKMENAAIRMYSMIDGVLLYSSLNATDQPLEPIDLNLVIKDIESDLEILFIKKEGSINYKDLPVIKGFGILIYQLFYNLINNSLKFTFPGRKPVIQISAKDMVVKGQHYIEIRVQDNGIGFQTKHVENIFKPFTRLNSKDLFEGTGLGLSLCKKIIERHGGTISANGTANEGATFTLTLPYSKS